MQNSPVLFIFNKDFHIEVLLGTNMQETYRFSQGVFCVKDLEKN